MKPEHITGGATFDRTKRYRYRLWRQWDEALPGLTLVMLNPSRADAVYNDQTISASIRLAARLHFGRIEVVNLFAYCTSDPAQLKRTRNPVGKHNDRYIAGSVAGTESVLIAWGNHGEFLHRSEEVLEILRSLTTPIYCLGVTKRDQPRHPLYLPAETAMIPFYM